MRTLALFASAALLASAAHAAEPVALHGRAQGTTYNIKYWTDDDAPPEPAELQRSIDALLARFDEQMSTWRPDSELSRFNAAPANEWFAASPETAAVVARGVELHRLTGGASDVTVGPFSRLWGFGAGADKSRGQIAPPSEGDIQRTLERVGAHRLQVRNDPPALLKEVDGLEIDLSSIAPGYAIDLVVDLLANAGVADAMVELGGEVRGVGRRPDGKPWRVGVQAPPPHERAVTQVIPLSNLALATSGDFHNVHVVDGARVTHIIDPRSGKPLPYRGACVTVVAETCFAADGVATALFVMDFDVGYEWCVEHRTAALFQKPGPGGAPIIRRTPRFVELVGREP